MVDAAGWKEKRSSAWKFNQQTQLPHVNVAAECRIEFPAASDTAKSMAEVQPVEVFDGEGVGPAVECCGGKHGVEKVVKESRLAVENPPQ